MDILKVFGTNLRKYREEKNISQEKFAEMSGLHRTYISDVERFQRSISLGNVQKIADEARIKARLEGNIEGKQEEKRNIAILLLTKKLGKLSDQMMHWIETSSTELIDQLIVRIFDIDNEEDVMKIMH